MSDDLNTELNALAPTVDDGASRALFERRSAHGRRTRHTVMALAAVSVLVAGAAAAFVAIDDPARPIAADGDETTVSTSTSTTTTTEPTTTEPTTTLPHGDPPFELLGMVEQAPLFPGTLQAAIDEEQLAELWASLGPAHAALRPSVDLDRNVVVSITIPDDDCAPTLTELTRDGEVLTPVFVEPPGGCRLPLRPKTFVVAIDRASVEPRFTLLLPAARSFHEEQRLTVAVSPDD